MPTYVVTNPKTGQKVRLTGDEPPTDEDLDEIFSSMPAPAAKEEADLSESDKYMSDLRQTNPGQAQVLDEMGTGEKILANIGAGFTDAYYGLPFTGENPNLDLSNQLEKSSGMTGTISRVIGQAAPFLPFALGASAAPTLGGRILGSAAVGGAEAGTVASGTGADTGGVVGSTLLGAALGGTFEAASPFVVRGARALIQKVRGTPPSQPLFDAAGAPSQELNEVLQQTGMTLDDLAAEAPVDQLTRDFAGSGMESRLAQTANEVQVNPERARAANEMGVNAPVSTLSDQSSVQEIAGSVLAAPGSKASEIFRQYTDDLTKSAEDLIQRAGGDLDKGLVSDELKDSMQTTIKKLADDSSEIYRQIGQAVPPSTIVNAAPLRAKIAQEAAKSQNGVKGLSQVEQDVYKAIQGKPTYFDLDNLRKDIGASIGRTEGTYITAPVAKLKDMYAKITQLQEGVADQVGGGAGQLWKEAKKLDNKKFDLQENSEFLFGKGNIGSVMPKAETALKQLSKGNTKTFNEVIAAVPDAQKSRVLATAMDSLIRKTQVDGKMIDANGFTKWYGELSSSPVNKKALTDNLPDGAGKSLDNLYLLTQGLANVTKNKKSTGIVPDTLKQIDKTDGLVARLFNVADKVSAAPIVGSFAGPGVRVASNIAKMATKERTPAIKSADELLASPEFKTAVLASTKDQKVAKIAEAKLKQTKEYKNYMQNQNKTRAASIASTGLIPFLMQDEDE